MCRIIDNMDLVEKLVNKFCRTENHPVYDKEDWASYGNYMLVWSDKYYDPSKSNLSFRDYALNIISNSFRGYWRDTIDPATALLRKQIKNGETQDITFTTMDEYTLYENDLHSEFHIQQLLDYLLTNSGITEKARNRVTKHYLNDTNFSEIGRSENCSGWNISQKRN